MSFVICPLSFVIRHSSFVDYFLLTNNKGQMTNDY